MRTVVAIIMIFFLISCKTENNNLNKLYGKWENRDTSRSFTSAHSLIFNVDYSYNELIINDDLVISNEGIFFLNSNPKRSTTTISLIPSLYKDSIMKECKNFDIISLTDSIMLIKLPTRFVYNKFLDSTIRKNEFIEFKKNENIKY